MNFLLFYILMLVLTRISSGQWFARPKLADDIILTDDQQEWLYSKRLNRAAKCNPIVTWPNKNVPYKFDKSFSKIFKIFKILLFKYF